MLEKYNPFIHVESWHDLTIQGLSVFFPVCLCVCLFCYSLAECAYVFAHVLYMFSQSQSSQRRFKLVSQHRCLEEAKENHQKKEEEEKQLSAKAQTGYVFRKNT